MAGVEGWTPDSGRDLPSSCGILGSEFESSGAGGMTLGSAPSIAKGAAPDEGLRVFFRPRAKSAVSDEGLVSRIAPASVRDHVQRYDRRRIGKLPDYGACGGATAAPSS